MPKQEKPSLKLSILGASDLKKGDIGPLHSSDPYVIWKVIGKTETHRTDVAVNTLNPTWNYHTEITDYEIGDTIEFTVWDEDSYTSHDELGKAVIDISGGSFKGELLLDGNPKSRLFVEVELPRPEELLEDEMACQCTIS